MHTDVLAAQKEWDALPAFGEPWVYPTLVSPHKSAGAPRLLLLDLHPKSAFSPITSSLHHISGAGFQAAIDDATLERRKAKFSRVMRRLRGCTTKPPCDQTHAPT
jgi:hypothetical protein